MAPLFRHKRKLIGVTGGAALGPSYAAQARPPLFVVVVGETARADHFSLNGYDRDTNPELAARKVLSWHNVQFPGHQHAGVVALHVFAAGQVRV